MRYTFENNKPVEIKAIVVDGMRIVYPTDAQVDEAEAGYPLELTTPPEYDSDTQRLELSYSLEDGVISQVWTIIDIPQPTEEELRIAELRSLLAQSDAGFETFKSTPIVYPVNGLRYKPSYIKDFWNSVIVLGSAAFPMVISDADCVAEEMTFEQFTALYGWLIQQSAAEIAAVNTYQAPLIAELKELESGQD